MRKTIALVALSLLLVNCDGLFNGTKKIVIKGKVSSASKINGSRVSASTKGFSLSDAKKVLIFYGNKYELFNINSDGSFTGKAVVGSATAVVFLTGNNQYIGNLFCSGLNVLPLVNLSEGENTQIDLSTLTLNGTQVVPANNPIGNEIKLSDSEITFMQDVGAYYETLSKNLDMDNDNSPDILDGKQIRINSMTNMFAGAWGTDHKAPDMFDPAQFSINTSMRIAGAIGMYDKNFNATLSGPSDNPYNDINQSHGAQAQDEFIFGFQRTTTQGGGLNQYPSQPFKDGLYSFQLNKNQLYTFNFSNINMQNHLLIIKPTIHTDNNGYITKISYEFVFPDGSIANPRNLIQGYIRSQINNNNTQLYEGYHLYGTFYAGDNYDYYNEKISKKIKLSEVQQCNFAYIDILGNEYEYSWRATK
ncbi:MAG: hypothetical protein PHR83_01670 [Paludibacter sp.]|nr:hypothetical protein [Paludibacter sp.]